MKFLQVSYVKCSTGKGSYFDTQSVILCMLTTLCVCVYLSVRFLYIYVYMYI